jgi:Fe-S oxidoreductase
MKKIPYVKVFERTRVLGNVVAPMDLDFVTEPPMGMKGEAVILHISCQVHNVPHIPSLAQKIMRALGISFTTLGGPENCCGAFHWHFGDEDMEKQVANISLSAFRRLRTKKVLSLCPDCDYSFGRYVGKQHAFEHQNISQIFVEHLDALKALMKHRVEKRVILHYHANDELRRRDAQNIELLMRAVPGLQIVAAESSMGPGFHCQTIAPMLAEDAARMFEEAKTLGADHLIVPYHSCYRQHCKAQLEYGVEVQYYLALIAQAMGITYEERFKELRLLDSVDRAMERLRPRIRELGYSEDEVRSYVQSVIYL